MGSEEKKQLEEWADELQDGVVDFLELTLELKDEVDGDSGWEWLFIMSLLSDQAVRHVRKGLRGPNLDGGRKARLAGAYTTFLRAYLGGRNESMMLMTTPGSKKAEKLVGLVREVLLMMPGHQDILAMLPPDLNPANEGKVSEYTAEMESQYDIVVVLPKDAGGQRRKNVAKHLRDELPDRTITVVIGKEDKTVVKVRNGGDEQMVNVAIDEVFNPKPLGSGPSKQQDLPID